MSTSTSVAPPPLPLPPKSHPAKRLLPVVFTYAWWIGSMLVGAGCFHWVRGWISIALCVLGLSAMGVVVHRFNHAVLEAREKWRQTDTKSFDKVFLSVYMPLVFLQPGLAAVDVVRFRWSSMPFGCVYPGALLFAAALGLIAWVLITNPFAENTVRIQAERGHRVISSGPYAWLRHPMYAGTILMFVGLALVWGSFCALTSAAVIAALLIWRAIREERALRQELSGYEEYVAQTRYRIFPGVW